MTQPAEATPRRWFEAWRGPAQFFDAARKDVRSFFLADRTPPQYLREAYVAGLFARIWRDTRGPCKVRLVPEKEKFPDAQLRAEGIDDLHLEVTMALKRGNRLFNEWRELRAKAEQGAVVLAECTEQRQASAREAIPRAIRRKANKHYAGETRTTYWSIPTMGRHSLRRKWTD